MVKPYVSGVELRAGDGSKLNLRGFNANIGTYHSASDIQWMRAKGYTVFRANVLWSSIEEIQGTYNWGDLDEILSACQAQGMYVILDMHQWHYSPYFSWSGYGTGVGFPKWLVQAGGYSNSSTGVKQFADDFFLKRGYGATTWAKFVDFWKKVIARYKNNPMIFGYEILNEPTIGAAHDNTARTACLVRYKEIIPIMRSLDAETIIVAHHIDNGYDGKLDFPNIIWTKSYYPSEGTTKAAIDSDFNTYKQMFNGTCLAPWIISECGVQPANQSIANSFLTLVDDEYRTILNNGTGIIFYYTYAKGVSGGYQGPRNTDGSDSWVQAILASWIEAPPPHVDIPHNNIPHNDIPIDPCQDYIDQIGIMMDRIKELEAQVTELQTDNSDYESQIGFLNNQITALNAQMADLKSKMDAARATLVY